MVANKFNHIGDIKLGLCSETDVQELLNYVKLKCQHGCPVFMKRTDLDEYYVSVPITLDFLSVENPYIYTHETVEKKPFYFFDLYIPHAIVCITYDTVSNEFISNVEYEGCTQKKFDYEPSLYEILPFSECNWENEEQYTQEHMRMAKRIFMCNG